MKTEISNGLNANFELLRNGLSEEGNLLASDELLSIFGGESCPLSYCEGAYVSCPKKYCGYKYGEDDDKDDDENGSGTPTDPGNGNGNG